jgi:hypothetical protein
MKEPKGLLDEVFEYLESGQLQHVKSRVREYVGLENAIKNAQRKKMIMIHSKRKELDWDAE